MLFWLRWQTGRQSAFTGVLFSSQLLCDDSNCLLKSRDLAANWRIYLYVLMKFVT